jgi:rubrerythrin
MAELLLSNEICDMAAEIERKGAAFYNAVAHAAKSPELRAFCLRTAEAERDHEKTFKAMLSSLQNYSPSETYPGEYLDYVHILLDRDVIPGEEEGKRLAADAKSEREAVDFAIQFEKTTILFLYEMRHFVPEARRDTVDELIAEERTHVAALSQLRERLGRQQRRGLVAPKAQPPRRGPLTLR